MWLFRIMQARAIPPTAKVAFAKPEIYESLEERRVNYAIRIPANDSLERDIAELLTRPVGRPSHKPVVWYKGFLYQAASWKIARRVVAKVEFHAGELFPRVGFIVTNLETTGRSVVRFYNKRGTAEQWIKEGKQAVEMTRLSCHRFRSNQARLALSLLDLQHHGPLSQRERHNGSISEDRRGVLASSRLSPAGRIIHASLESRRCRNGVNWGPYNMELHRPVLPAPTLGLRRAACDYEMEEYLQDLDSKIDVEQHPLGPESHPHKPRKNEFRFDLRTHCNASWGWI